MTARHFWLAVLACLIAAGGQAAERVDILLADFEGEDWGDWKVTGTAFGPGPARGTLPNQMPVTGFEGKRLANSYHGGDDSTGTLTSPAFKIQRKFLNFLIGGGKYPAQTCINLLVDGKVVRSATGPNDKPGGSEHLNWHGWDVTELTGKNAVIQIVDNRTGGWGHICIDHIIQSDRNRGPGLARRELLITGRYLHLPVQNGATKRRLSLGTGDQKVREFEIELAEGEPNFWAFLDVSEFKGKTLRLETVLPADSKALSAITQGDEIKGRAPLYQEKYRPQFHFTSRRGWLNDPNGLVYFQGEYHLYYQHNPHGWDWGNMHWGHAVSKDLVHWQELPIAIYPRRFGDWAFSGSAVVDRDNTSGFQTGKEPPLIAAYTSTARGECIVFSNDRGRTWKEYDGNPVVKHSGRDPRLLWHAPSKQWVMAVYDEHNGKRWIAFYTSADLKKWEFQSRIEGFYECPDLFELPVDGKQNNKKWVLYAADGQYVLGSFDGRSFTTESGKHRLWYGDFYAAQTFSDTPDGRRLQIGWGRGITFPGMPFNQQMTVPCQLTLRTTKEGVRLFAEPVKEIEALHGQKYHWTDLTLKRKENPLQQLSGDCFDIRTEFEPDQGWAVGFNIRGVSVVYSIKKNQLICKGQQVRLDPINGKVRLRLLVDRGSIEVFGNDGQVAMSIGVIPADNNQSLGMFSSNGETPVRSLTVYEMKSAWDR